MATQLAIPQRLSQTMNRDGGRLLPRITFWKDQQSAMPAESVSRFHGDLPWTRSRLAFRHQLHNIQSPAQGISLCLGSTNRSNTS